MNKLDQFLVRPQLTTNFHIDEFACKDGTAVPWNLVQNAQLHADNLQVIRDYVGQPLHINSGYRNPTYNNLKSDASESYHTKALATDLRAESITPKELFKVIQMLIEMKKIREGGLSVYPSFVHYDSRGFKARW